MPPAPDGAEPEFLNTVRFFHLGKTIEAVHNSEIVEKSRQGRRIESQTGEFNAVSVDVEDNSLLPGNEQPSQDSKFGSLAPEKLNQGIGIVQGTGINNHLFL